MMQSHTSNSTVSDPVRSAVTSQKYSKWRKPLTGGLAVIALVLLSSCASKYGRESLIEQLDVLQASTDQARQASEAAEAMATRNQTELQALRRDVDEARELATQANARVDNAFKASQVK